MEESIITDKQAGFKQNKGTAADMILALRQINIREIWKIYILPFIDITKVFDSANLVMFYG